MADVNRTLSRAEWNALGAFLAVLVATGLLVRVAEDLARHRRAIRAELSRARRRALDAEDAADRATHQYDKAARHHEMAEARACDLEAEVIALRADVEALRAAEAETYQREVDLRAKGMEGDA